MAEIVLKQCYFCEDWFSIDKVKEVSLERTPSSHYDGVYLCNECLNKPRIVRLAEQAANVLQVASSNEVELSRGGLKVRLVRFTPAPTYIPPWQPYQSHY